MSALYLGVVVLPLVVLVWNLGAGGRLRRMLRRDRGFVPASASRPTPFRPAPWLTRLRALPRAFAAGFRAARGRSGTVPAAEAVSPVTAAPAGPSGFELAPDLPRSPSTPGWVPAHGYAARPRATEGRADSGPAPFRAA